MPKLSKSTGFQLERVEQFSVPANTELYCKAEIKWLQQEWCCWINNGLEIKSAGIMDCCEQLWRMYAEARWEYMLTARGFRFIAYY
jgi:hypothetical protein